MATPKSILYQLHKHWDIVEQLTRLSRQFVSFDLQTLERVINRYAEKGTDSNATKASLLNAGVLQRLSRRYDFQLNPVVLEFTKGLTREHELGLSEVLKVRVEGIQKAASLLSDGIEESDTEKLGSGVKQLTDLFRKITLQLEQDKHAIMEISENAKSSNTSIPIERRYREVLEAYDQYVEPMNDMMDSGSGASFYPMLEQTERILDQAVDTLSKRGALYHQRLAVRQIAYQTKELRLQGRLVAKECAQTLLPLRQEVRQHNQLTTVISRLLGGVRKLGSKRVLGSQNIPGWLRERNSRIQVGSDIRNFMAEALNYQPNNMQFPEEHDLPKGEQIAWVDEHKLKARVNESLPINNLMEWLKQNYSDLPDPLLLRLYHELAKDTQWVSLICSEQSSTKLHTIKVKYHAHVLDQSNEAQINGSK